MKTEDILIIAAVALGVFFIGKRYTSAALQPQTSSNGVRLVQSYGGWDYYSDGTAIDNGSGCYYYQGRQVSCPSA